MATISVTKSKPRLSSPEIHWFSKPFNSEQRISKNYLKIQPNGKKDQKGNLVKTLVFVKERKLPKSEFGQNPSVCKGKRASTEISEDNSVVTNVDHHEGVNRMNYQKRQKVNNVKPVPTTTASYVNRSCGSVNHQGRLTDLSRDSSVDSTARFSSKDTRNGTGDAYVEEDKATINHDTQMSPRKALRVAMLKSRFADTILKAQNQLQFNGEKVANLKMQREKEVLQKKQKEARIRVAAEVASKKSQQAKLKSQREREREAFRIALENMVKTVEICECQAIMRDYEMLISHQPQINLGLVLKTDYYYTEEEEGWIGVDVEEGEIIF